MASCRTVEFLYRAIPLRVFRDLLIRTHMEGCKRCRARLASPEEVRGLFVRADDVGPVDELWRRLSAETGRTQALPGKSAAWNGAAWRWATAAALVLVVAVTGFWLLDRIEKAGPGGPLASAEESFRLGYVNVGGAPAQTFIYQPLGSDTVFVWAQRVP
jgi:hypothetical protein